MGIIVSLALAHPIPSPSPTMWTKRILFLALLVLQSSSLLATASNKHVNANVNVNVNNNNSPALRSPHSHSHSNANANANADRWRIERPRKSQPLHHRLSNVKSTEALLRKEKLDCPDVTIRGGGDSGSGGSGANKNPSSFQKRTIASIVLLAGLSVVVSYGREPGLQLLVWTLTPGLYNEATSIVEQQHQEHFKSKSQSTDNPQATPTNTAASGEVVAVLAPEQADPAEVFTAPRAVWSDASTTPPATATATPDNTSVATSDNTAIAVVTPDTTETSKQRPFINKWWWFVTYTLGLSSSTNHLLQIPDVWLPPAHLASFGMIMGGLVQVVYQLNARGCSDRADFERACRELAIAHLGIILTLVPATAWMSAVHLFGKEWVLYAAFLVVINDTAAYVFGKNFGKHALLPKISPNKTWEGWMGALASTLILSFPLWKALFRNTAKYDRHALVLALYCAVVAPFGGFLASTVKRAYGKKDFGSLIAGHGGLIDRLDCQLVTAPFLYLYLTAAKVKGSPFSLSV